MTAAARDFGLDDKKRDTVLGGYMMAAFFLIGAPSAIIVSEVGSGVRLAPDLSQDLVDMPQ